MSTSSPLSSHGALDDKPPMCLSPQDKLKGSLIGPRKKPAAPTASAATPSMKAASALALAMDFDMADADAIDGMDAGDLDIDLVDDDTDADQDMDDAGWISDDNLRALEFDERLNQEIDWVAHDDVEGSLKLQFVPAADDEEQDFAFDPSSFLSPLRGSLSYEGSSSFAESLSVDTPPPSFGTSHDAEKLLMSFDTMNFTIPSPTSGSSKKRAGLFGKTDADGKQGESTTSKHEASAAASGSMSPSLKTKAGVSSDDSRKDSSPLPKLAIPAGEQLLGVLSVTTPTGSGSAVDPQKKIGSYSPEARRLRIQKFHEKRKNRTWKKSIKYDCRKKLADDRPRIKGRFVRVLENTPEVKEEDTCSTASTASTSVSSPRSVGSPAPSTVASSTVGSPVSTSPAISASSISPVMQVVASALAAVTVSTMAVAPVATPSVAVSASASETAAPAVAAPPAPAVQ